MEVFLSYTPDFNSSERQERVTLDIRRIRRPMCERLIRPEYLRIWGSVLVHHIAYLEMDTATTLRFISPQSPDMDTDVASIHFMDVCSDGHIMKDGARCVFAQLAEKAVSIIFG